MFYPRIGPIRQDLSFLGPPVLEFRSDLDLNDLLASRCNDVNCTVAVAWPLPPIDHRSLLCKGSGKKLDDPTLLGHVWHDDPAAGDVLHLAQFHCFLAAELLDYREWRFSVPSSWL